MNMSRFQTSCMSTPYFTPVSRIQPSCSVALFTNFSVSRQIGSEPQPAFLPFQASASHAYLYVSYLIGAQGSCAPSGYGSMSSHWLRPA